MQKKNEIKNEVIAISDEHWGLASRLIYFAMPWNDKEIQKTIFRALCDNH